MQAFFRRSLANSACSLSLSGFGKGLAGAIIGFAFVLSHPDAASAENFSDSDWNLRFYNNCGFPVSGGKSKSVRTVRQGSDKKILVTLKPGDVGQCSTDAKARNNAAYWERAELKQKGSLAMGAINRIDFSMQVTEGFEGERESFFQIHAHDGDCWAYPPLMLMFDGGALDVRTLRGVTQTVGNAGSKGQHRSHKFHRLSTTSFAAQPRKVSLRYDTRTSPGRISVVLDGSTILRDAPVEIAACGKPHIKFGLYRPGPGKSESTALFDDLTLSVSR